MKKKCLIILLFFIISSSVFSQVTFKPGVRAGINHASVTNTYLDPAVTFYGGLFIEMRFAAFYALQPEVIYSSQGGKSNVAERDDLSVDYISVGIINKFYFLKDIGLHALIGPTIDTNINENFVNLTNGQEIHEEVTPIDFTLIAGIGFDFDFGLSVEARYKRGFIGTDLYDTSGYDDYSFSDEQFNSVIQVGASYKFDFSKK